MQKKLIALAVAGLISAPVFAQSAVQVYGVVDLGFGNLGSSNPAAGNPKFKNRSAMDHGNLNGSRLGFRGTEDLGNGLKASFVLEYDIQPDVGGEGAAMRQSFLALSGNFGTVAAGRQYTPQFNLITSIEPTGGSNMTSANVYDYAPRLDNLFAYVSPNFGGFTVTAGYSFNAIGNENLIAKNAAGLNGNTKAIAISPVYRNGPLMVGANWHRLVQDNETAGAQDSRTTQWDIGGTYDFGVVKLGLAYGRDKHNATADANFSDKRKWMAAVTVPVTEAGRIAVSYENARLDARAAGASDPKAGKLSLTYIHDLSKRTALYTSITKINTNSAGDGQYWVRGSNANASHTRGFYVGVRHFF